MKHHCHPLLWALEHNKLHICRKASDPGCVILISSNHIFLLWSGNTLLILLLWSVILISIKLFLWWVWKNIQAKFSLLLPWSVILISSGQIFCCQIRRIIVEAKSSKEGLHNCIKSIDCTHNHELKWGDRCLKKGNQASHYSICMTSQGTDDDAFKSHHKGVGCRSGQVEDVNVYFVQMR